MSSFDIIWLIVCIGLPVLSGVLSAGKKQKAKTEAGEPAGKKDFLEDIFKEVVKEFKENSSSVDIDVDEEENDSGKTESTRRNSGEMHGGTEIRDYRRTAAPAASMNPAAEGKSVPSVRPAMAGGQVMMPTRAKETMAAAAAMKTMMSTSVLETKTTRTAATVTKALKTKPAGSYHPHAAPEHLRGGSGVAATEPVPQKSDRQAGVERIDPKRMIIYDAVLNPKFRE